MHSSNRSFFRFNLTNTMKNFSKSSLISINNACSYINAKPFSEILEIRFATRKRILKGQQTHDIGVMFFTNLFKGSRKANFSAKISIVQSDGKLHFCRDANVQHLNEKDNSKAKTWRSIINVDEIFADEKKFLNKKSLKIHIGLEMTENIKPLSPKIRPTFQNYENLVNNPEFSDIKIICSDDKAIHAHMCILMAFENDSINGKKPSQFFRTIIESRMQEGQSNQINVHDIDSKTMENLMRYIYTGKVCNTFEGVKELLIVADNYDFLDLKPVCAEALENQLCVENVVELLKLDVLKIDNLKENCIDFIKFHFDTISQRSEYDTLPAPILRNIIESMSRKPFKHEFVYDLRKIVKFAKDLVINEPPM